MAKKRDECLELQNLNYKTLLQTGNSLIQQNDSKLTMTKIDEILCDEKNYTMANSSWPKLSSKHKQQKLLEFAINYCKENKLDKEVYKLKLFLKNNKHHLQKTKDVVYNKKTQIITSIPRLEFKQNRFFLHKENRQSITKGLSKTPIKSKNINNKTKKVKENM
jgi:hypothetical protein